jgi:hypothetical protein
MLNKNFLLFLLLGVFFINFINALEINVYSPFEAPFLENISNTSGGSWSAGEYNFTIVSSKETRGNTFMWTSPLSNIIQINLSEDDKAVINYTIPNESTNPEYLFVYYQDGSHWKIADIGVDLGSYPVGHIIDSPYETTSTRYTILENFDFYDVEYWGLNLTKGIGRIEITGSSGTIGMSDVVSSLESSNLTKGEDYLLAGDGSIISTASLYIPATGGTVDVGGHYLSFFGGIYSTASVTVSATPASYGTTTYLLSPQRGGYTNPVNINNLQGRNIVSGTPFKDSSASSGTYGHSASLSGDIKSSLMSTWYSTIPSDLSEGSIFYSLSAGRFWDSGDYQDITTFSDYAYLRSNVGSIYDTEMYTSTADYQIFWLPNAASGVSLYDVNIYLDSVLLEYNEIDYYDWNGYGINTSVSFYNSVRTNIVNEEGLPISDVKVLIRDKDNSVVYNKTTPANGSVEDYILTYQHSNNESEFRCYGCGNNTDYNPFVITISKEGYETYNLKVNISEKKSWSFALSESEESPASFNLDKIISLHEINNTNIVFNISLKLINKGESNATNVNITDSDSLNSPYFLGTLEGGETGMRNYLINFERNSTNYINGFSIASSQGIDALTNNFTYQTSSTTNLVIPQTTSGEQLTLIKNAYYNSENSTQVNYSISIIVVNSGGTDLNSISIIDNDLNLNTNQNLNRTQNYSYTDSILIDKAASNTDKLFTKTSATANTITYQSNQIQVLIPGYGGPADAIVNAPSSVQEGEIFTANLTVRNMNTEIGQDFIVDYWITNENESSNYSSGQQTIYVAASGETNFTADLTAPNIAGNYKLKALVSWTKGTASAFESFQVTSVSQTTQKTSSTITTQAINEIICNYPYMRFGIDCCLDKDNNSVCDEHEKKIEENQSEKRDITQKDEEKKENPEEKKRKISEIIKKILNLSEQKKSKE